MIAGLKPYLEYKPSAQAWLGDVPDHWSVVLRSLYRVIQFCQCFTNQEIVSTLSTQMSWSRFIELLPGPKARR